MDVKTFSTVLYQNAKFCNECNDSSLTYVKKDNDGGDFSPTSFNTSDIKENQNINSEKIDTTADDLDYCKENDPTKLKSYQCKTIIQRVRSLLDEIKAIKRNETFGICDFCKRYNSLSNCKRCEILAKRHKISTSVNEEVRKQRFNMWLTRLKQFLYTILEKEMCQFKLYHKDHKQINEFANLLNQLKVPLDIRQPYICHFMCIDTIENLTESKDILEEVISKLGKHNPFADTCGVVSCPKICKKIPDKKKLSNDNVNAPLSEVPVIDNTKKNVNSIEHDKVQKKKKSGITKKLNSKEHRKSIDDNSLSTFDKNLEETKIKDNIVKKEKPKRTSEDELMAKLMKSFKIQKEKTASEPKSVKIPQLPNIADLPTVQRKIPKKILDDPSVSESIVECDMLNSASKMMIKGTNVVPYKAAVPTNSSIIPILFESKLDFTTEGTVEVSDLSTEDSMKSKKKSKNEYESKNGGNIFKYMLSDQKFIERGWTMLPTTKILRRMNVYKMIPTNPQADWFKKHQNKRVTMYNTGEKFAEIYEDGKGRWYYKNGKLALDYYKLQGTKKDYRYVIYSSGENHDFGRNLPVTVLASFDSLGNGVVYDHYGNERLKYNQSEGLVVDEKIGPRGRWKWHTLNDPPVLTPVLVDTHVKLDKCFQNLGFRDDDDKSVTSRKNKQEPDDSMLTIELENFMKEKAHKLMQKFKPLHIKMKALKINNQFSLKILDQSNIYLMFRDGKMSIKLSLGLLLMSNEIIDSETSELSEVATVYDIWPPKSQSIADLQQTVEKARRLGKCHAKLRR